MFQLITTTALAAALLAATSSAQLPAKDAEKQLKDTVKQTLQTWHLAVDNALDSFAAAQAAFDSIVKSGGFSNQAICNIFALLNEANGTVLATTLDNAVKAELKAAALLDDVAGTNGDLQGLLPKAFQSGSGGALDGLRLSIRKSLGKDYLALAKRFAKTAKALLAGSNVGLNFRIDPPCAGHEAAVNQNGAPAFDEWPSLTVDSVLAASRLGITGDGILLIAGSADAALGAVTVTLMTGPSVKGGEPDTYVITLDPDEIEDQRWILCLQEAQEGNWVISATQGPGGASAQSAIDVP